MATVLPLPPQGSAYIDPRTGAVSLEWSNYFLALEAALSFDVAPRDAQYWVSTSNGDLTNERNIGLLSTGYLRVTTAIGIATPSTTTTIPAADIAAGTAGINISGNAATATALQTARTINGTSFNGTGDITVTASANTLTGTALPALNGAALTALNASNLASGTVPDARFPATLPAVSGANLTNLTGANITGGGVYTPTRSAETNITGTVTMSQAQYARIGSVVTVSGRFTADPTLTATPTSFEFTLPIASNIGAVEDAAGVAFCGAIAGMGAELSGSVANNTAVVSWLATDITSQSWSYTLTYRVI